MKDLSTNPWNIFSIAGWIALCSLGCVSSSEYRRVEGNLDALKRQNAGLTEKTEKLEAEQGYLYEELSQNLEAFEDLSVEHQTLERKAEDLTRSEAGLETKLGNQSRRLAASTRNLEDARAEVSRLASTYTDLMADLESEVSSGQIEIEQLREGLRVSVSDDIIFASGSADLDPIGRQVLDKVSRQLQKLDYTIEVQGHTDDRGLKASLRSRYPSNWELAAARASRVVRLMQEQGIDGSRLRVVSFASFQPLVPNESDESRSRNRRIEIRLKPRPGKSVSDSGLPGAGD
ncbi:MAG: OmpA family protein [Myxococcota bacterium]|nr:OmpA family protein [Myxococcota bacterium]